MQAHRDPRTSGPRLLTRRAALLAAGLAGLPGASRAQVTLAPSNGKDDTPAFEAAAAVPGASIRVPAGRYLVRGTVQVLSGQTWTFDNAVIVHSEKGPAFEATARDWLFQGRCRLEGGGIDAAGNHGLVIHGSRAYRVTGLQCVAFGGIGLHVYESSSLNTIRGERGQFSDLAFNGCDTGIAVEASAEYNLFTNTAVAVCNRGIVVTAGNTQFVGGNVVDCLDGIVLKADNNDSHGGFHAFNVNHSGRHSVVATGISNGHTFSGCHFIASSAATGSIYLKDSVGVLIQGGQIDCAVLAEGRRGRHFILNNVVVGKYFRIGGDAGQVICRNNFRYDGTDACAS